MSELDQVLHDASSFGLQLLFRQSLVAPLLQAALEDAVTDLPWFAGRLVTIKGGREFDVACCNSGARLLVASTPATLAEVAAVLRSSAAFPVPGCASILNPYPPMLLPVDTDAIVRQKLPLAAVLLLHLRGGGALLLVSAYHGIVDFEALQSLAAHLSAAYNRRLAAWQQQAEAGDLLLGQQTAAGVGVRPPGPPPAANPRTGAFFHPHWAADVLAAAEAAEVAAAPAATGAGTHPPPAPPAAGGGAAPARPENYVMAQPRQMAAVVFHYIREVFVRGGGLEGRVVRVPAARLEQLKEQANRELQEQRQGQELEGGRIELHASSGGAAAGPHAGGQPPPPPSAEPQSQQKAAGRNGSGGAVGAATWVSARDAASARITQLLHALPVRRQGPMILLQIANMRGRMGTRLVGHTSTAAAAAATAATNDDDKHAAGGRGRGEPPSGPPAAAAAASAAKQGPAGAGAGLLLPRHQLGNMAYGVWLEHACPSAERLGHLAATIRTAITHHMAPQFRNALAHLRSLLAAPGADARRLTVTIVVGWRRRVECLFALEGPLLINHWIIRHELWQFGPEPPLEVLPAGDGSIPNLFLTVDSPPPTAAAEAAVAAAGAGAPPAAAAAAAAAGGSSSRSDLVMVVLLHKLAWRQLDAATGGDLAAAL
ncbi:hypothetical protein HXX76_000792 [Chlamydomonas incerta]|uniref:Uncharacterized protein n=1 Tax=Chlamydomonas incerta TaxID=51695 RepID=A0A836B3G0_CHLIN|nr:hypothetical protein HXX76_000792 [Chlamydomonas incerta]|eukprot:KAG2446199.1 hypothetical protein HXX76_000792 [Chlamydomonas incerta]